MDLALTLSLAALAAPVAVSSVPADSLGRARQLVVAALSDNSTEFVAAADPAFLRDLGGQEKLLALLADIKMKAGAEVAMQEDRTFRGAGGIIYDRYSRFEKVSLARVFMRMSPDGLSIKSFRFTLVRPKTQTEFGSYKPRTKLRLPFGQPPRGTAWTVAWAGTSLADNYHARRDTHFAIDVSPRAINDPTPPTEVEDTACWGSPILAAGNGVVARTRDGMRDIKLNEPNATGGPGNHVIIDHGNSEYTLYAHLRLGSVVVKPGQTVEAGDTIGMCGNSGESTEPHLHFQLMNDADLEKADGLPLVFQDYFAPLRHVAIGSPVRGDVLLPGAAPSR